MSLSPDWDPYMRLLTIAEAAESVDRPRSTIRRWLAEGLKISARMGTRPLILESDLLAYEAVARARIVTRD